MRWGLHIILVFSHLGFCTCCVHYLPLTLVSRRVSFVTIAYVKTGINGWVFDKILKSNGHMGGGGGS